MRAEARSMTRASSAPNSGARSFRRRCFALSAENQVGFRSASCGGWSRVTSQRWAATASSGSDIRTEDRTEDRAEDRTEDRAEHAADERAVGRVFFFEI